MDYYYSFFFFPFLLVVSLLSAVTTSFLLVKLFGAPPVQGRNSSIDGLRGYLAFFVFLHHSDIFYFYMQTGEWNTFTNYISMHLGQTSVVLFFMITGFLFFSKLINEGSRGIDWGKLFISRFLRLAPLYFFTMSLLFTLVAVFTDVTLHEPVFEVLKEVCQWLLFTVFGDPNINSLEDTSIIVARVTWTLPYEWFFYLSLPLLAIAVGIVPPYPYIALGIVGVVGLATRSGETHLLLSFLAGMVSALLFRSDSFRQFAVRKLSSFILLGCLTAIVTFYQKVDSILPFFLLSFTFALIACGNTIFGILTSPASRMLGDISYSIYLLHGISIMFIFNFVIGVDNSHALSLREYWLRIVAISPCIVIISFITYRLIELPAIKKTPIFTLWLRESLSRVISGIQYPKSFFFRH